MQRIVRSVGRLNEVVQNLNSEMEVRAPLTRQFVRLHHISYISSAKDSNLTLYPP